MDLLRLITRAEGEEEAPPACVVSNDYDGRLGLRISALFVIWIGSTLGANFPVFANRHRALGVPGWVFFVTKFFGSGVIIATAFIHLLSPASDALRDPCLTGPITEYDWVSGIALMTIFALFFIELMAMRYATFSQGEHDPNATHDKSLDILEDAKNIPGEDHLGHTRDHSASDEMVAGIIPETYSAQVTAIFILEFGVIFHSIFIGLTLAVSGEEFRTLYIVLVFHQTFEGLGLGSRLALIPWPKSKRWTPYFLATAYGLSTPIAIAIGLGVRESYSPGSATSLIVNGVFDSVSAGILIYTGLVELMAHEFIFSATMRRAPIRKVLFAFGTMCLGAGLMALLGKWA
ncbi:MAG: hypothetical protein M1814_002490 [Vezdaea aestivalis]|nr:MAG: hypothetical protein M1814_002490 [Vezdaea aestivalis]